MDPLSVTASIVGILAAAGKIGELLHGTISTAKDAPRVLISLSTEVQEVRAALSSLQILLADLSSAPSHRTALIQIDQLIITLTDSVFTFSELETAIAPFIALQGAKVPLRARLKWVRAEDSCVKIVDRLQRHKSTINLMLNILQCASDVDAKRSQTSMDLLVQKLVHDNGRLTKRLRNLEDAFDAMSVLTRDTDRDSIVSGADTATISSVRPSASNRFSILEAVKLRFAFDDDLQSSRAYRMVQRRNCNDSILSCDIHTQTWSIFSGLSLAHISVVSVIALPLYPEDVVKHQEFYHFEPAQTEEVVATWTHAQVIVDTSAPDPEMHDPINSNESSSTPSTLTEISSQNTSDQGSAVTSLGTEASHNYDEALRRLEGRDDESHHGPSDEDSKSISSRKQTDECPRISLAFSFDDASGVPDLDVEEANSRSSISSSESYPWSEADDEVYPCKGCGEILEEGKAFELAGNRWHINCFRCNTCGTLLDSDDNLLLLGDGSLICRNCTYDCNGCGNKIEDLAILTGDQAFCAGCFRCRNCKRKIENLRYARTSQGIFCMGCHESLMARRRMKTRTIGPIQEEDELNKRLPDLPQSIHTTQPSAFSPKVSTPESSKLRASADAESESSQDSHFRLSRSWMLEQLHDAQSLNTVDTDTLFPDSESTPVSWDAFLESSGA